MTFLFYLEQRGINSLVQLLILNILRCQHREEEEEAEGPDSYGHMLVTSDPSNSNSIPSQGRRTVSMTCQQRWDLGQHHSQDPAMQQGGEAQALAQTPFSAMEPAGHKQTEPPGHQRPAAHSKANDVHSKSWKPQGCLHTPPSPWGSRDSRFSVDGTAWKRVRGLSLQDGGLESPLFFRDRCSWALVRGTSGTVLNICISG